MFVPAVVTWQATGYGESTDDLLHQKAKGITDENTLYKHYVKFNVQTRNTRREKPARK